MPWLPVLSRNLWVLSGVNFESGLVLKRRQPAAVYRASGAYTSRTEYLVAYNVAMGAVAFAAPEFGLFVPVHWHMACYPCSGHFFAVGLGLRSPWFRRPLLFSLP